MTKYFKYLVWLFALAPLLYLAATWNSFPDRVAIHFDLEGQPDKCGNKNELIVMVTILSLASAGIYFLLSNIYKVDPKKYAADNKDRLQRMGFAVSVFISAIACFIIYSTLQGGIRLGVRYIFCGVGLLFSLIGNYMYNIKPNYFAGMRIPWTLNNEENWRKTHLLAGKLWFAGGLFIALLCLLLPEKISLVLFFLIMAVIVIIPVIYSYRLYKKNKEMEGSSTGIVNNH